jgi:thiosulfate reductase/polysulfide reductase chain A
MAKLSRRDFLGLATAAGALASVGPGMTKKAFAAGTTGHPDSPTSTREGQWIPTCCMMCGGQTGIKALVSNGRVVKIEPNPENPIGVSNISTDYYACKSKGSAMCPKGNAGIAALYDPDRVKKPLLRVTKEKGKEIVPEWKEISWDEALTLLASKLKALQDANEQHKLLWFSEDASFVNIQQDFCNLYGTPNLSLHSNLCDVARKASWKAAVGNDRPLSDPVQSKYILYFGWNPLSAVKWSHLPGIITRGLANGAKMVVVDPFLSLTASKATEWVPIRPGTDGALALAMGNVIIRDNLIDQDFVRDWVVGYDQYKAYVADKTPQWAEKETGIPAATIERLAKELGTTKPATIDFWSGPGQHSNGVFGGWAIAALAAITGNVDRPGTMIIPDRRGDKRPTVKTPKITQPRYDSLTKYPMGHSSGVYVEAMEALRSGKGPYQPKVGVVVFQNLVMSVPGTQNVIEALKKLEFLCVVDTHLSETALMADLVLPGTVYLERYDVITNWVTFSSVALRQPVVKPLFGQLPEYQFVIELGKRLGLKDTDGKPYFETLNYEEYLSKTLQDGGPKMTLQQLKDKGGVWIDSLGTTYEKHKNELKPEVVAAAKVDEKTGAIYTEATDKDGKVTKTTIGVMVGGKACTGFATASRKVELFNEGYGKKNDANGNALPTTPFYKPRDWQPDEKYPLYLVNWKEVTHTHSRTFNNPLLMEIQGWNPLYMNGATAQKLGIKTGDEVWVESPYGKAKAKAQVTQGMHPDVVGWQHGFGHWGFGEVAKGRGTADGQFNVTKADPVSGMALHKEVCVKVYKA